MYSAQRLQTRITVGKRRATLRFRSRDEAKNRVKKEASWDVNVTPNSSLRGTRASSTACM